METSKLNASNFQFFPEPTDPATLNIKKHLENELKANGQYITGERIAKAAETLGKSLERRTKAPGYTHVKREVLTTSGDRKIKGLQKTIQSSLEANGATSLAGRVKEITS